MPKQATPRKLSEAELHRELRRADTIIDTAWDSMNIDSRMKLVYDLSQIGLTSAHDPLASTNRHQALNRTEPTVNWLQLALLALLMFVTACYAYSQSENKALKQQLAETLLEATE